MEVGHTMQYLITGASGQLGSYLLRELENPSAATAWSGRGQGKPSGHSLRPVDLADQDSVVAAYRDANPQIVVHSAAISTVGGCYEDPERAQAVNENGTRLLTELAAESHARFVFVSTDLVFDGEQAPYAESDKPSPLSRYGQTKAAAEAHVLAIPRSSVVRVSLLFGPAINGRPTFFDRQLESIRQQTRWTLFADEWRTPLSVSVAAAGILAVATSDHAGILHMGGPERLTRLEMSHRVASYFGLDGTTLVSGKRADVAAPEPRPRDVSLDSSHWQRQFPNARWPNFEEALAEFATD